MSSFYNKYRPKTLDEMIYHKQSIKILKNLDKKNIPHLILYGLDGCGKKTMLYAFLKNIKKKKFFYKYKTSNKEIQFTLLKSNNIIEINIDELGIYNKFVIRDVIKEFAQTKKVDNNAIQIIILHHTELLDKEAQYILRRIMELYIHSCRFILLCNSINKIIKPLRSRSLCIRINCLTDDNILTELKIIKKIEGIKISENTLKNIINTHTRNFKICILQLEYYTIKKSTKINEYDNILLTLMKCLNNKLTFKIFNKIDEILYKLLVNNDLNTTNIFKLIYNFFIKQLDNDNDKIKLTFLLSKYEYNYVIGSKDIFHLQAFVYNIKNLLSGSVYNEDNFIKQYTIEQQNEKRNIINLDDK